jgi:hypothetical protein
MTDDRPEGPGVAAEELAGRYGRHLFILAYHLCGDPEAAARLAARAIAGQAVTGRGGGSAPPEPDPAARSIELYRGLLETWRSGPRPRVADAAGPLHQALAGLDAEARVVAVLRIAEGFDYEEMAVLIGLPAPRVRASLVRARRHLQRRLHRREIDRRLHAAMTLYLDSRLSGPDLAEFEKRLKDDRALREAVEFHRGLTLEFREEVPAAPAGFADRVRLECDRPPGGRPFGARPWESRGALPAAVIAIAAVVFTGGGLAIWRSRSTAPEPAAAEDPESIAAGEEGAPDPQTVEALRSLGYIGGDHRSAAAGPQRGAAAGQSPSGPTAPAGAAAPVARGTPAAAPGPARVVQDSAAVVQDSAPIDRGSAPIAHRVVPAPIPPPIGRDLSVARSAAEWATIAGPDGAAAPAADFGAEMIVLLRGALGADPPTRLVVTGARRTGHAIEIEARIEPVAAGADPGTAGQVVILPASDREVRLIVR